MPLKGKTVFITGGTGGIGRPLVALLREAGADVHVYDQKRQGDLVERCDHICQALRAQTPDILINMAGFNAFDYCENQDLERIVALNMMVPLKLSQAVLPGMKERGQGQIVNIGSMTALIPLPHLTGYVAAKAGLKGFNDALRREVSGTAITVTHIIPRAVRTGMNTGTRAAINDKTGVTYDDPAMVAARIFKAIIRREREVRLGWPERLFALIQSFCPALIDKGLQKNRIIGEEILRQHHTSNQQKDTPQKDTKENHHEKKPAEENFTDKRPAADTGHPGLCPDGDNHGRSRSRGRAANHP